MSRLRLGTQLVALLLGTVALVVLAMSLAGTAALRSYLVERIDDQLRATVHVADARGPGGPGGQGDRRGRRGDVAVTTLEYDAVGRLRPVSALRLEAVGGPDVPDPAALPDQPSVVRDVEGDRRWRVLPGRARNGDALVAAVALDGIEDTVGRLVVINVGLGLVALTAAGVLARWAVRRSLRPLLAVEQTAHAIADGDLSVRVPPADPRTEVGGLAASFNVMVDRFETAFTAQQTSEAEARASEVRMRQFVADASHELRTPLTSIRGYAELFRQGAAADPAQLAQVMQRIEDEAARMGLLVEDLLLLARLDQQRPLRQDDVDLLAVASDVVRSATAVHGAHHVVRLHVPDGGDLPVVRGDEARLHQVLTNLVGNAVAHTAPGSTVDVSVGRREGSVRVQVRDDGAGMPPAVAARVFERFYRADTARVRVGPATSGTGLGLSIVAALVAAHGGTVEVESAPGEGSCFTVLLPARPG